MSLNFDLKAVSPEACYLNPTAPEHKRKRRPETVGLIQVAPLIGIGEFTPKNIEEVVRRVEMYQDVAHPLLWDGKESIRITPEQVRAHVGLWTNVLPARTKAWFQGFMARVALERVLKETQEARENQVASPDADGFFYWTVRLGVHHTWVQDGFDLSDDGDVMDMLRERLGYAREEELRTKLLEAPPRAIIRTTQGERVDWTKKRLLSTEESVAACIDRYYKPERLNREEGTRERIIESRELALNESDVEILAGHHDVINGRYLWIRRKGESFEVWSD